MIYRADSHSTEIRSEMRGGNGDVEMTVLHDALPKNCRLFNLITLKPGCSIGYHTHDNETELFYFISGTARIKDDEKYYQTMPGDVVSTGAGHGHSVANESNQDVTFLACIITA